MSESDTPPHDESKLSFFRQSGWMIIATFVTGALMWAVHPLSKTIESSEYEVLGTMLRFIALMAIPAAAIQVILARHTSAAITKEEIRHLAAETRSILKYSTVLWLLGGIVIFLRLDALQTSFQISNTAVIWLTYATGLVQVWWAACIGIMQGRQNFQWFGIVQILNGVGRVSIAWLVVHSFQMQAAGIMSAAFIGLSLSAFSAAWQVRDLFRVERVEFSLAPWIKEILPLAVAMTTVQLMLSVDQIIVNSRFPEGKTGGYLAAVTLANALVIFTIPIAAVMFPKLVRNERLKSKSNILPLTLLTTLAIGAFGAICLTFLSDIAIGFGFNERFKPIAPLIPWFAWCILPLALNNVLVSHFIARAQFRVTTGLALIAVAYFITLLYTVKPVSVPDSLTTHAEFTAYLMPYFKKVVQTMGAFNLLLLAVAGSAYWLTRNTNSEN